jgi:outer membrane protease
MRIIPSFLFLVILCGGFIAVPVQAQSVYSQTSAGAEKNSLFAFSAYVITGMLYGQSEEIVYKNSGYTNLTSQLLWDIKALAYIGPGLSFSVNENREPLGLYADISFRAGIPFRTGIRTGTMEDKDWTHTDDPSILTHFSSHENYTLQAYLADLVLGISLPLKERDRVWGLLKLGGAFSFMYFDWMARNGYTQYDPGNGWDSSDPVSPVVGDAIGYSQRWFAISPGAVLLIPLPPRWKVEVSQNVSPGWIRVYALDRHIARNIEFYDTPKNGILLESGLKAAYSLNDRISLELHASYRYIAGSRGDSWVSGSEDPSPNGAGAGFRSLDAGLNLKGIF